MSERDVYKKIQREVDDLLDRYPWLWEVFQMHAAEYKDCYERWKAFRDRIHRATDACYGEGFKGSDHGKVSEVLAEFLTDISYRAGIPESYAEAGCVG